MSGLVIVAVEIGAEIKDVILSALDRQYVAFNVGVETGNHYQSINLGDTRTAGFREDRGALLDLIDFQGKKVLDLGSNLGELSRATRTRGAFLVDGFEFDPYFVEIANLVNAFTATTHVSFFERDISDPASYVEQYDIVLAFAVFGQGVSRCLSRISELTDVLVVETHKLEGNFDGQYIGPTTKYFPSYRVIGQSQWGSADRREIRAVAVFAKTDEILAATLGSRGEASPGFCLVGQALRADEDVDGSAETRYVDVGRTDIQTRFFEHYAFDSADELLAAVDTTEIQLSSFVRSHDIQRNEYRGWGFWFLYLKGYCQYLDSKQVRRGNVYYDYLLSFHNSDPVLSPRLEHPDKTAEHVARQFRDMNLCHIRESDEEAAEGIQPLHVVIAARPLAGVLPIFEIDRRDPLPAKLFDGWHRLFAAKVFGVPALRCVVLDEAGVGPLLASIEEVEPYDGGLEIRGWCLHPRGRLDRFAVETDEKILPAANVVIEERPDVQAAFGKHPHALRSGFQIRCDCQPQRVERLNLELTAFGDWHKPLGKINLRYAAGMFSDQQPPPISLARRLYGATQGHALAIRSQSATHDLLDLLSRFRSLSSFRSVLDLGCGTGLLEQSIHRFLPGAKVTAAEMDDEAIEWCQKIDLAGAEFIEVPNAPPSGLSSGSFDLVLSSSLFQRLNRDAQVAWLGELDRLMQTQGYAALAVLGELAIETLGDRELLEDLDRNGISDRRLESSPNASGALTAFSANTFQTRDYTIDLCQRWFDVIGYIEGGVVNQQDLIVLRGRDG